MSRRPRVHFEGVPLHIVQRGHNREPCFFCEEDYLTYRHWLGAALGDLDRALHAYVLMTNHAACLMNRVCTTQMSGLALWQSDSSSQRFAPAPSRLQ